jgi:hypothetical protein
MKKGAMRYNKGYKYFVKRKSDFKNHAIKFLNKNEDFPSRLIGISSMHIVHSISIKVMKMKCEVQYYNSYTVM